MYTPLMLTGFAYKDNSKMVEFLLSNGADPNARTRYGDTALTCTCAQLFIPPEEADAVVKLLIEAGAELEYATPANTTALCYAAMTGKGQAVKRLVEAGANCDVRTVGAVGESGLTPLDVLEEQWGKKEYFDNVNVRSLLKAKQTVPSAVQIAKEFVEAERKRCKEEVARIQRELAAKAKAAANEPWYSAKALPAAVAS